MRPTIRTFIAIDLSERVKRELGLLQERLKITKPDIKWVDAKNLHLTLKFLGDIQPEILDDIEEAIARTAAKFPAFHMDIGIMGAFPKVDNPRIIWAGITKRANFIAEIVEQLDDELKTLKIERPDQGFMPHITIGRTREGATHPAEFIEILRGIHIPAGVSQKVKRLNLYRSELFAKGPVYHLLYSVELNKE